MTGESKIVSICVSLTRQIKLNVLKFFFLYLKKGCFSLQVQKHAKEPFLMSGCKVADGSGTMLVKVSFGPFFSELYSLLIFIFRYQFFYHINIYQYLLKYAHIFLQYQYFDHIIWRHQFVQSIWACVF